MKKVKLGFWLIIIVFLVLIIYQNQDFFRATRSLSLNLIIAQYFTPEIPIAVLFLAAFMAGLLIAYIFGLLAQFRARKTIKNLNTTINSQIEMITSLKQQTAQQGSMPVSASSTGAASTGVASTGSQEEPAI
ncbi:MAG: LapA family protein [Desulfosarcinaceae bacterium]|nr:LapA family protein [Desulfosarcinaceae bacterium]